MPTVTTHCVKGEPTDLACLGLRNFLRAGFFTLKHGKSHVIRDCRSFRNVLPVASVRAQKRSIFNFTSGVLGIQKRCHI